MTIRAVSLNSCIDRTLVVPGFSVGAHVRGELREEIPAGKAVNVARILAALGTPVELFALVGRDRRLFFKNTLADKMPLYLYAAYDRTRINTTILDPENGTDTHIREHGAIPDTDEVKLMIHDLLSRTSSGDIIVFAGSLPPTLAPERFGEMIEQLRTIGAFVAVDTSGVALTSAVNAGCNLIKPNRDEFFELIGTPDNDSDSFATGLKEYAAHHAEITILASDGPKGAYLFCDRTLWHAVAHDPVSVCNTVGAGDALLAGFLAGLHTSTLPDQCLLRAIQTATAHLGVDGVAPERCSMTVNLSCASTVCG